MLDNDEFLMAQALMEFHANGAQHLAYERYRARVSLIVEQADRWTRERYGETKPDRRWPQLR
jgi:hypothetical protein